ncbi:MAG: hypothetical protein JSU92_01995 [Deltaproteobacteria bacterium]|nr:MAG: hypothetical protein JSU92_01995 [Deltaproteobacteria bacterium]
MKITVGVIGSAGGRISKTAREKSYLLGKAVAESGCVLLTGGCPGIPFDAARGAKEAGGIVVGISPGIDLNEHVVRYKSPTDYLDILIFTGTGLMGREVTGIRSCDVVVVVSGRSGTLGEFSIAYDEGRPIGVMEGTGGITREIKKIVKAVKKKTGSTVLYDSDPKRLVARLLKVYKKERGKPRSFSAG